MVRGSGPAAEERAASEVSEWTVSTLKEHYDTVLALILAHQAELSKERDLRFQQRFEAGEKRLDGMNEFRGALNDAQKTFVTWPNVLALIFAACAMTSAVLGVVTLIAAGLAAYFLHK